MTDDLPDPAQWQTWWNYNGDGLIDVRSRLHALATSSGENPVRAERRRLQELLAPALVRCIESGGKDSVLRQALIALARLAKVPELGVPLDRLTRLYFQRESPSLREAALLALGIGGDGASIGLLRSVLMDDASGRALLRQEGGIATRLRAYAAYSLGLLGRRVPAEHARRQVVHALLFALGAESAVEREIRVACTLALGLVPIQPCASPAEALDPARQIEELHLCGGAQTEYLLAIAADEPTDPWFRGHAAASLGRLAVTAGPGFPATEDHPLILSRADLVRALVELARDARGAPPVQEGCLIGLGFVADADADKADAEARALFLECTKKDGPMAQRFALLSLAAAFGRPGSGAEPDAAWKGGTSFLMREFSRAKGTWLPWYALAFAVTGHGRAGHQQPVPESFVEALREGLKERDADGAAAYALGLAVLRPSDPATRTTLAKAFDKHSDPLFRSCGALALGLLGVSAAQPQLEKLLDAAGSSLEAAIAASVGLRLLGDPDVVPDLLRRLADAKEKRDAAALVRALAFVQDPSAGEPLLALALDDARGEDERSAMVWCLGSLADPDAPDWTALYANGLGYNYLTWTLKSPLPDGRGLLDWR